MKPEDGLKPVHGYNFEVFSCPTVEELQKVFDENKDREGFYPYYIPQSHGVILVVATRNPEAFLDTKLRIELGLQPLKEHEAKGLLTIMLLKPNIIKKPYVEHKIDAIDTYLTILYEHGYEVCKRVEKEVKP